MCLLYDCRHGNQHRIITVSKNIKTGGERMKKMKEKVLKCVIKTAERVAKTGGDGWPPCIGYIYQPKRPVQLKAPKK